MSVAASVALFQLVYVPYYWEKTQHGLHLQKAARQRQRQQRRAVAVEHIAGSFGGSFGSTAQLGAHAFKAIESSTYGDTQALPVISSSRK
jgi:hypothetical protein